MELTGGLTWLSGRNGLLQAASYNGVIREGFLTLRTKQQYSMYQASGNAKSWEECEKEILDNWDYYVGNNILPNEDAYYWYMSVNVNQGGKLTELRLRSMTYEQATTNYIYLGRQKRGIDILMEQLYSRPISFSLTYYNHSQNSN